MVKTSQIYQILATQFDEPKARVVADAIVEAVEKSEEHQEANLKDYIKENCASKNDVTELEMRLERRMSQLESNVIKYVFGLVVSQAVLVLGGVCYLVLHR